MAAYAKRILDECQTFGCHRDGEFEVRNGRNAPMGRHCERHAMDRVKEINEEILGRDRGDDHG